MTLCLWYHKYPLGFSFDTYLFLLASGFSIVIYPVFTVTCLIRLAMVSFINLLDAVTFFLEALNWYTTSLSEKYSNDRLFSNEAKFSCYSAA